MVTFWTDYGPDESVELRMYECLRCGHHWYEDCDASDYPEYCPGCGGELVDDEEAVDDEGGV